ncbi:MAG: hypothetical protein ACLP8S_30095 [Solirubrobacteraceae bacterium]
MQQPRCRGPPTTAVGRATAKPEAPLCSTTGGATAATRRATCRRPPPLRPVLCTNNPLTPAPTIKKLARSGVFQPSLFDEQSLATITGAKDFPDERLIVCRNPLIAAQRTRKRQELLAATETDLAEIAQRVVHGTLAGADQIGLAVGPAVKR